MVSLFWAGGSGAAAFGKATTQALRLQRGSVEAKPLVSGQ
jgi:hypothetical protein